MMNKRKRAILVVSVEIDPIVGAMDDTEIASNVRTILYQRIPHYNPEVVRVDDLHKFDYLEVMS